MGHARTPRLDGRRRRVAICRLAPLWLLLSCLGLIVLAPREARSAAPLPALTGRVVDDAALLSAASQSGIETKLKALEDKSSIQLVVATVKSLGGEEVEPFANRLFRTWGLGQKGKDNGVLLLVAPAEHRAKIEVGYKLEGTLTDALSKIIITNALIPRIKAGDVQGGIERATDDIITVLSTDAAEWKKRPDLQAAESDESEGVGWMAILFVVGFVILVIYLQRRSGRRGGGGMIFIPPSVGGSTGWGSDGGSSGGGSSSGDSGGGFSGGGGSSGGGGASGQW